MSTFENAELRPIGEGACGTVWALPAAIGNTTVIKRENRDHARSLYNDFIMHRKIYEELSAISCSIHVPRCHKYVSRDNLVWWEERITFFPKGTLPCNIVASDRIPPFPEAARDQIFKKYCPESGRVNIRKPELDHDCLIRPYLGQRRPLDGRPRPERPTLRNYPLYIDQMEELNLDTICYAKIMAETLAELYWRVKIDAADIEFVLAPPRERCVNPEERRRRSLWSWTLLGHVVWILDFDCCRDMSTDKKGVRQAVGAFYRNDPYYPRPGRQNINDQTLWSVFKERFLEASKGILDQGSPKALLPDYWIELVQQLGQAGDTLPGVAVNRLD